MFTDQEAGQLVVLLTEVLEENHAGQANVRKQLAKTLVAKAREYLEGRYRTRPLDEKGITKMSDIINKDDFPK